MAKTRQSTKICVVKTFRFDPQLMEDVNRIVYLVQEDSKPKYGSVTNFVVKALKDLIRKEKMKLEDAGVVWEHLKPKFEKIRQEE